jgi:hypothetical protein
VRDPASHLLQGDLLVPLALAMSWASLCPQQRSSFPHHAFVPTAMANSPYGGPSQVLTSLLWALGDLEPQEVGCWWPRPVVKPHLSGLLVYQGFCVCSLPHA